MSLQVIAASEGTVAVIADEVLLHLGKRTIPILVHDHGLRDKHQVSHTRGIGSALNSIGLLFLHIVVKTGTATSANRGPLGH